jgi:uncharacterized OsmC-like protein
MSNAHSFSVTMKVLKNYSFQIDFGDYGNIISDEPEPLGGGEGPNPVRLLAASVANCLAASLMFAIRKYKEDPGDVSAEISGELERVDKLWRVNNLQVDLFLGNKKQDIPHLQRALEQFEDFCIVTQSVRKGIAVNLKVFDKTGDCVHSSQ